MRLISSRILTDNAISYLLGFMSLHIGLSVKSGLCSFMVIKESLTADISIPSSRLRVAAIALSLEVTSFGTVGLVVEFSYVFC